MSNFNFTFSNTTTNSYKDSEALFMDLKNRDKQIQHLWAHQADILRAYHKDTDVSDVALELPTGAGKTLIGLLIAEWRRTSLGQKVIYLCPTRQLANQVGQKATEYGIEAHVLIGPQNQYPPGKFAEFANAKAIAISTYSGLFNSNPKIGISDTMIFDDAHAGENYVAKMWSMNIQRSSHKYLYEQLIEIFSNSLPNFLISSLRDDNATFFQKQSIEMLGGPKFYEKISQLHDLFNGQTLDTELSFAWNIIREKLSACNVFISWNEILIRPWIPPTQTHIPFATAKQRLYMSATLGPGGELERIFGISPIKKIPVPKGWDKQSNGRRLFIFPDYSFTNSEYEKWLAQTLNSQNRNLVLTPNGLILNSFLDNMTNLGLKHTILKAHDIEDTLDTFTKPDNVTLGLTNRYDGLDLPGDSCRALTVNSLPTSVNLQEKFLWARLGLTTVLKDRIKTRITQAVGRCTRNSTDYAVVFMVGSSLFDFCINKENRAALHPELRAEIEFGLDNSKQDDLQKLSELITLFLNKDKQWNSAEIDITKRRDETTYVQPESVTILENLVSHEINYIYNLWKEDYEQALNNATYIVDNLSGNELSNYRALWNYFAGCAAHLLAKSKKDDSLLTTAKERFIRASQSVKAISWFNRLLHETEESDKAESSHNTTLAAEAIHEYIINLGIVGPRFDRIISELDKKINSNTANEFDAALTELGKMLGFNAAKPSGNGAPDSTWRIGGEFVVLFESKSDETPQDKISISNCRQTKGHIDWENAKPYFSQNAKLISVIITPRTILDVDAKAHANDLYYQHIESIRELFKKAVSVLRKIRSKLNDSDSNLRTQIIEEELINANLTPDIIIGYLTSVRLIEVETK